MHDEPKPDRLTPFRDADRPARRGATGLSPARLADLRRGVRDGRYDSLAVADAVAARLLASGDL